jgi:hypothetical protein
MHKRTLDKTVGHHTLPWERWAGEPKSAYKIFRAFSADPTIRKLDCLSAEFGIDNAKVRKWAVVWRWFDRTAAKACLRLVNARDVESAMRRRNPRTRSNGESCSDT